jgi:hypothetical protein
MSILRTTMTRTIKRTRIRTTDSVTLTTGQEMTVGMATAFATDTVNRQNEPAKIAIFRLL